MAPHHDRVPAAIDDLIAYRRRHDIPVLIQAAIAHAQFKTIHPFTDGNGRTGRALNQALLRGKGVTRTPLPAAGSTRSGRAALRVRVRTSPLMPGSDERRWRQP